MSTDKLKELLDRCKCSVSITVNEHRDYYDTAAEHLEEAKRFECPPEIEDDVRAKMIETNTIIKVHFYPETPISFYQVWHYDIDAALDESLRDAVQSTAVPDSRIGNDRSKSGISSNE